MWAPWLLLGAIQLTVVLVLAGFAHPALSWFMAPWLRAAAGEDALHYPNVFRLLPGLYARVDLLVTATLGVLAAGAATYLFAARLDRAAVATRAGEGLRRALARAVPLIAVNLPLNLLVVGLSVGLEWWVGERDSSGLVRRFARLFALGGALVLQAFFVYGTALVILGGRGVWGALRALPHAARQGFWAALCLSVVGILPLLPVQELAGRTSLIVDRGAPEVMVVVVAAQIALTLLMSFLLAGSVTVVYQGTVAPAEAGAR